ncbi:MAG: S9 family peptidase [Fibrobacter sp.]|nr:S9 family peptidase [Fibrobacter sp.]
MHHFYPIILLLLLLFTINCTQKRSEGSSSDNLQSHIISDGIPSIPDSLSKQLKKYQNTRSASFQGWMADGSAMVILTRFADINQIHLVKHSGGARHQLTFRPEPVIFVSVCPDTSKRLIFFLQDSGGNEKFQIYQLNVDDRSVSLLTDGSSQHASLSWSNKGDLFAYTSTRRNGRDWDIYLGNTAAPEKSEMIFMANGYWSVLDWSPDDHKLLLSKYVSSTESFFHVLDLSSRKLTPLSDTLNAVSQESGLFAADGNGIFLTSDENSDFRTLRYYDLKSAKETALTPDIPWNVREIAMSKNRKLLAFTINEHGFSKLYLMDTRSFKIRKIETLPSAIAGGIQFHPLENLLGITVNKPNMPGDAFVVDLDSFTIKQWTHSETGELDCSGLAVPRVIEYPSFDSVNGKSRMIPCFSYKPKGEGPFPVLINIHGGPESQFWPYFSSSIQYYVNDLNIAVLAPNVRGSAGYGKEYLALDNGMNRENSVKDIGALIEWIKKQPDLDSTRIAVMGGSYGGYMALSSMIHYNTQIRAGIDLFGISNYVTFLENTASYRRDLRRVEYGDERDPVMRKFLLDISPVTHASKIRCPLLIIQGANDARVPASESHQIADAVRKNKGDVWFLIYGNEGHGFRRKNNRDYQDAVIALFLKKYLVDNIKTISNQKSGKNI